MTAGHAIAFVSGLVVYTLGVAVPIAIVLGKGVRLADEHEQPAGVTEPDDLCDLVVASSWSQAAINNAFDYMLPDLVTADSFQLDAQLNRKARGGAAS